MKVQEFTGSQVHKLFKVLSIKFKFDKPAVIMKLVSYGAREMFYINLLQIIYFHGQGMMPVGSLMPRRIIDTSQVLGFRVAWFNFITVIS